MSRWLSLDPVVINIFTQLASMYLYLGAICPVMTNAGEC